MKPSHGAQYVISIDGVPRTYRDRRDIALQTASPTANREGMLHHMFAFPPTFQNIKGALLRVSD